MLFKKTQAVKNLLRAKLHEDEEHLLSDGSTGGFFEKKGKKLKTPKKYKHIMVEGFNAKGSSETFFFVKKSSESSFRFAAYILIGLIFWLTIFALHFNSFRKLQRIENESKLPVVPTSSPENVLVTIVDQAVSSSANLSNSTEVPKILKQYGYQNDDIIILSPAETEVFLSQQWFSSPAEMNTFSVIIILILVTAFYLADYLGYY